MTVSVFLGTLHENSSVDQHCELGIAHQDTVDLTLGERDQSSFLGDEGKRVQELFKVFAQQHQHN